MNSAIALFPKPQIAALIMLCRGILLRHPIPSWRVLGHSDVAPARKDDPGELFPWAATGAGGDRAVAAARAERTSAPRRWPVTAMIPLRRRTR